MNLSASLKFAACFAFAGLSCSATTLYNLAGTVLDGNTGENTYISANGSGSGLVYTSGSTPSLKVTLPGSGSYAQVIGNFTSTALTNIGDSITFSYSFTVSSSTVFSANDQTFRVGLLNSNGSPITGNTAGTDANASSDTGYMATYRGPTGTNGTTNTFYQRTASNNVLMSTSAFSSTTTYLDGAAPTLTSLGISSGNLSANGSFTITLISGGVRLSSIINGGAAQTRDDTTGSVVSTFDQFGFFGLSGSANPFITLTDLTITYTSAAVPEPSTSALLAGAIGLITVMWSRRFRRRAVVA